MCMSQASICKLVRRDSITVRDTYAVPSQLAWCALLKSEDIDGSTQYLNFRERYRWLKCTALTGCNKSSCPTTEFRACQIQTTAITHYSMTVMLDRC